MPISEVMTTTTTTTTTTSAESNRPVSNRPTTTGSLLNRENNSSSETNYLKFQTEFLLNNNNGDNLNVNGRKYAKNAQKSIWSYNPDDISIRSKLVRNNHKNSNHNNNNNGAGGENVRVGSGGFRAVVGSKDYFTNYFLNQQLQFKPSDLDVDQIHDHSDELNANDKRHIDLFNHHYQQQQQHQHQQSIIRKQNGTPNTCSSSKTSYYQLPDEDNISKLPKNLISIDSFNYSLEKLIEKSKQDLFKMTPVVTTATAMTKLAADQRQSSGAVPSSPTMNHHQHYQMRTLSPRSKSTLPPTTNATSSSDSEANLKCQSSTSTNSNSSSSSISSQKFAEFNQPIPARTTPTKLIEKYSCRLTNTGSDTNTHASNSKSTSNLTDDQLNVVNPPTKQSTLTSSDSTMTNDPFKNNISKLIKNRYTIETANKETENITSQSTKSTSTLNRNTPVVCYAKHIDNLTPRTLENMSNGLNRNLLEPMGRPNNNSSKQQQNANANKTSQQKLATSDETTGGRGAAQDRDYLDEIETFDDELNLDDNDLSDDEFNDDDDADEEEEEDDYIELDDDLRDIDYEDDKIIFETNISSSKQKQQQGIQLKNNLVMKICNDIKSYQLDDMARKRLLRRRLRKSKSAKLNAKSYAVNNDDDDEAPNEDDDADNKTLEERRQAVHEADRLNLNQYDEDNYDDTYDYEYEYKDVIGDDFRRLLDRYDGTVNADQYLRQNLPSLDEYLSQVKVEPIPIIMLDGEVEETIDDRVVRKKLEEERRRLAVEKARETYFFLKRMIIKKKYVMCTLKVERDTAAHKRGSKLKRTGSILKSRPVTASVANLDNPSAFKAVSRPKTVNIIPVKQTITGANAVSGENLNSREDGVDEPVHQKYEKTTSTTADLMNEHESTYEIYRLSPNTLNTQKWPFEVDFAESKLTKSQSVGKRLGQQANSSSTLSKTKPAEKCYPCKKLPVMGNIKPQAPTTNLQQQPVTNRTPSRNVNPTSLNRIKSSPSKLMKQPIDTDPSSSTSNTPTTSTVLNATYNSSRRSFLAKLNLAQKKIAPATTVIVVDGAELSTTIPKTTNEPSSTDDSALYTDELKSTKKYLDVNLREQFRKMNILPGKTFKSQRKKSISIEHVPVSRRKIHTQKTRILLTAHSSVNLANDPNDPNMINSKMISNQNYSVQNLNDNFQKSKSTLQQESADRVSVNDQLSRMIQAKPAASSSSSCSATSFSSNLKKNLALAIQHHEEIYSLIKSNHNNNNVSNNNQPSVKNAFIDNSLNTSPSLNSTDLSSFIFKASKYSLRNDTTNSLVNSFNRNRPKTSKV